MRDWGRILVRTYIILVIILALYSLSFITITPLWAFWLQFAGLPWFLIIGTVLFMLHIYNPFIMILFWVASIILNIYLLRRIGSSLQKRFQTPIEKIETPFEKIQKDSFK